MVLLGDELCLKKSASRKKEAVNCTEKGGFEPPKSCPLLDFESSAFDHSAIFPSPSIILFFPHFFLVLKLLKVRFVRKSFFYLVFSQIRFSKFEFSKFNFSRKDRRGSPEVFRWIRCRIGLREDPQVTPAFDCSRPFTCYPL